MLPDVAYCTGWAVLLSSMYMLMNNLSCSTNFHPFPVSGPRTSFRHEIHCPEDIQVGVEIRQQSTTFQSLKIIANVSVFITQHMTLNVFKGAILEDELMTWSYSDIVMGLS